MRFLVGILFAAVFAVLSVHAEEKSDVADLDKTSFAKFIAEEPLALIEFFAPWCGHCQALAPHYEEAATELLPQNIKLAKVDCTKEEALCSEQEISGFPTLKVFRHGNAAAYSGPRKKDGIVSYMRKQQLPAVSSVSAAGLDEFRAKDRFVIVAFVDEGDKTSMDAINQLAEKHRNTYVVGVSHDKDLAAKYHAKFPGLVAFRTFDEPEVSLDVKSKSLNLAEMEAFVNVESVPLMDEVSPDNFARYIQSGLPLAYYFVSADTPTLTEDVKKLAEVAKEFRNKVNLVWIDAVKFGGHAKALNLKGDSWPALAIQDMESGAKYPLTDLDKDVKASVHEFLSKFVSGKLKPSIKSAPVPSQNTTVVEVVADVFDKYVFDDAKDVLLEVYAPWCGFCKHLAPTYQKLADLYATHPQGSSQISIVKMDGTENDIPPHADITLTAFPTILLKPAGKGKKDMVTYEGDRTLESLIDFIAKHGTHKVSVEPNDPVAGAEQRHDEL